jgi:TctA family transporter
MEGYTPGVHSNNLSQKLEPTEPSFHYNNYYNQMRQICDSEINPPLIRILTGEGAM